MILFIDFDHDRRVDGVVVAYVVRVIPEKIYVVPGSNPGSPHFWQELGYDQIQAVANIYSSKTCILGLFPRSCCDPPPKKAPGGLCS